MADGNFTDSADMLLRNVIEEAMAARVRFNALRLKVAAAAKMHGVFVYGTERVDGAIVVSLDHGQRIVVPETASYQRAVSLSTW